MSDELKSCPFCGGKVEISTYRNEGYQIECPNHEWPKRETWMEKRAESDIAADIGMYTWGISDEAKAALIEAWNTRANEPADCGTVEDGASQVPELDTREHMDNGVSVHMCPNGSLQNLARHSKASQVFSDGFSGGQNKHETVRQDELSDTREKLEADVQQRTECSWVTAPHEKVIEWLDRQAAITEREVKLRELYKFEENHRANIDATEEVNRKLNERIAELTATCDALREQREHWFNEAVEIYRRFYPHDEYGIPQNIAEMVLAKVEELQATNKPNSQFDVLKTAENAENATSKNEIHDFDDSRERLEADVLFVVEAWKDSRHDFPKACPDVVLDSIFKWLDRQAAITERELCVDCDWPLLAVQPDEEAYDRIDELTAEVDSLREALDACGTGTMYELWRKDHAQLEALRAAQHEKPGT